MICELRITLYGLLLVEIRMRSGFDLLKYAHILVKVQVEIRIRFRLPLVQLHRRTGYYYVYYLYLSVNHKN